MPARSSSRCPNSSHIFIATLEAKDGLDNSDILHTANVSAWHIRIFVNVYLCFCVFNESSSSSYFQYIDAWEGGEEILDSASPVSGSVEETFNRAQTDVNSTSENGNFT